MWEKKITEVKKTGTKQKKEFEEEGKKNLTVIVKGEKFKELKKKIQLPASVQQEERRVEPIPYTKGGRGLVIQVKTTEAQGQQYQEKKKTNSKN